MIENYVNKFIENLPDDCIKYNHIDLVLDGGIFNGSYLIGGLYFLKEMEKRKYIKIDRISGSSVGSIAAFLYLTECLDFIPELYEILSKDLKTKSRLNSIKKLKELLQDRIPENICSKLNNKLFICYYDIKKQKKIVKSRYDNIDVLFETIIRSCYIPYLIDNSSLYKNKYLDGLNPYLFKKEPNKKILYMELYSYDKFNNIINIKNEKSNFHRILSGLLDIHSFFIKKTNTHMCSYVEDWNIVNNCKYNLKILLENIIVLTFYLFYKIKKYIPEYITNNVIIKLIHKIIFEVFVLLLENYCL
jgi:hypothetical protein